MLNLTEDVASYTVYDRMMNAQLCKNKTELGMMSLHSSAIINYELIVGKLVTVSVLCLFFMCRNF